jgi:hypothetical protein
MQAFTPEQHLVASTLRSDLLKPLTESLARITIKAFLIRIVVLGYPNGTVFELFRGFFRILRLEKRLFICGAYQSRDRDAERTKLNRVGKISTLGNFAHSQPAA